MSAKPPISVAIPVYNGGDVLPRSLDSILDQTFSDFELVISDNASTDATEDICRDYARRDKRIRYSRNDANLGAAPNFNQVFQLCNGRLFKWHAHDDMIRPTFLEWCKAVLDSDPDAVNCTAKRQWIDADDLPIDLPHYHADFPAKPRDSYDNLTFAQLVRFSGVDEPLVWGLMRPEAIRRTRLMGSYYCSDAVFLAELRLCGTFRQVPERLYLERCYYGTPEQEMRRSILGWDVWFDPRNARKRFQSPSLTLFIEHLRAINRADVTSWRKAHCYAAMFGYVGARVRWQVLSGYLPRRLWHELHATLARRTSEGDSVEDAGASASTDGSFGEFAEGGIDLCADPPEKPIKLRSGAAQRTRR